MLDKIQEGRRGGGDQIDIITEGNLFFSEVNFSNWYTKSKFFTISQKNSFKLFD